MNTLPRICTARCLYPGCTWGHEGDYDEVRAAKREHKHQMIGINWRLKLQGRKKGNVAR